MIGTIRKHKAWLWAIIITAIIFSFVIYFNPTSKYSGRDGGTARLGSISGRPISQNEFGAAYREMNLWYFFRSGGNWPESAAKQSGFDVERETYFRLLMLHKLDELHISVDDASVAEAARERLLSMNRGKPLPLAEFEKQILLPRQLTVEDLQRFLRHELGIQQMVALVGANGNLFTPQEARMLYIRENEEVSAQAVFFNASNHLAGVAITPEAIGQFYTNQMSNYRLPDRVQVSYVEFLATNYWAEAAQEMAKMTNLEQNLDMEILQQGTNYYGGAHTTAESRQKMRDTYQNRLALGKARKAANDFATKVFDLEPRNPENLAKLAQPQGLAVEVTAPFDSDFGPKEFPVPIIAFTRKAFGLTADDPFGGPIVGDTAVYVMAMNKQLPSEIPSLESIHAQVVADYTRIQATYTAQLAAAKFYDTVTNAMAGGKSFNTVCIDTRVNPVLLPSFSLSTRELPEAYAYVDLNQLKRAAFSVPPGKANSVPITEGGLVVFVNSRLPVDEAKMNADMPRFYAAIRQSRQNQAFGFWFSREVDRALRDVPALQPKAPPGPANKK